jgi:hypothetical protein
LLYIAKQVLDLLDLKVSRLQDIGRTGVVVDDSDGKDLQGHHVSEVALRSVVLYRLFELRDAVVVLVRQLPPVRTQLRDAVHFLSF